MDCRFTAISVINRKEIQRISCDSARRLAESLIPLRKDFNWKRWEVRVDGRIVDISRMGCIGGDWIGLVESLEKLIMAPPPEDE